MKLPYSSSFGLHTGAALPKYETSNFRRAPETTPETPREASPGALGASPPVGPGVPGGGKPGALGTTEKALGAPGEASRGVSEVLSGARRKSERFVIWQRRASRP